MFLLHRLIHLVFGTFSLFFFLLYFPGFSLGVLCLLIFEAALGYWIGYIQLWERCIWVYNLFTLLCCLRTALLQITGIRLLIISV